MARGANFGFSSAAERFPERRPDVAETYVGPGYYNVDISLDKKANQPTIPGVNMALPPRSQTFLSQEERFRNEQNKTVVPGPGHYSNEDLNNWFKRSYNMIFTE